MVLGASPSTARRVAADEGKMRHGLAELVADPGLLDARLLDLMPGLRATEATELPVLVLLREPHEAAQQAPTLRDRGARILRVYQSLPLLAIAARPAELRSISGLDQVRFMVPTEVVVALDDEREIAQDYPPTGTPIDLGVPALWDAGATGEGIRIAILDTGTDLVHPDLDDLDFRHWRNGIGDVPDPRPAKIVDARNFNGGGCAVPGIGGFDGHGHGTHVAGIAAGTGEGDPLTAEDDGRYLGIAPDAGLGVAKVLTDAGAGVNSDLIAAFEWAALPAGTGDPTCPAIGAHIVNTSLGSESRPVRLNTGRDVDMVSLVLDRLAVRYGTTFVTAGGNSGPYIGSILEAPGAARQALTVGASAKSWDVDHDATASGDTCAGYLHAEPTCPAGSPGEQGRSLSTFSSRGGLEGRYLKPDVVAPGYNIVSTQSSAGIAIAQNDLNINTRHDPRYATATGTSMSSPATAGVAALLLDGYLDEHRALPEGPSGLPGIRAPSFVLLRAALMNTARPQLREGRWMLTTDDGTIAAAAACPRPGDPFTPILCDFADIITGAAAGSLVLQDVRNDAADPLVGPLGEGAGLIDPPAALRALRDGVVIYRAATNASVETTPKRQDYQGSWVIGAIEPRELTFDRFVMRAAPGSVPITATFSFDPGSASDGTRSISTSGPGRWAVGLPGPVAIASGKSRVVTFSLQAPAGIAAGTYSGAISAHLSDGTTRRIPVMATVPLHDRDAGPGNTAGATARIASAVDVFAKGDTEWPSLAGAALGAVSDWRTYAVDFPVGVDEARFRVWDAAAGDETYDLYLYDKRSDLVLSTHPFSAPGVTDQAANDARRPTPASDPQELVISAPAGGRWYIVVSRAKVGTVDAVAGDFGAFVLTLDEVAAP